MSPGGVSPSDIDAIVAGVWNAQTSDHQIAGSTGEALTDCGLTVEQAAQLEELWRLMGLDENNPVTRTKTTTTFDGLPWILRVILMVQYLLNDNHRWLVSILYY